MPILRCEFAGGGAVDIPIDAKLIPRVQNGMLLPDVKIEDWDKMPKRSRAKMQRDYEWLMKLLTKAKLQNKPLLLGALKQPLGHVRGNLPK